MRMEEKSIRIEENWIKVKENRRAIAKRIEVDFSIGISSISACKSKK